MTIDLSKAHVGQRYVARDGEVWTYVKGGLKGHGVFPHELTCRGKTTTFTDKGHFWAYGNESQNDLVRALDEPAPAPSEAEDVAAASQAVDATDATRRECLAMVEEATRQKDAAERERDKALADEKVMHETLMSERENWAKDSMTIVGARLDALKERGEAATRLATLAADNEALRRDAERYFYLRNRDVGAIHQGGVFAGMTPQNIVLNGEDLDRAIDGAMLAAAPAPAARDWHSKHDGGGNG